MSSGANDTSSSRSCQGMLEKFFSLSGCTVILTGGARGIGLQLLKTLLTAGADVACLDILAGPAPDRLHDLKLHAGAEDSWVCFYKCDVTDEAAVEQTLADVDQKATQRCRPITGLVNCAGIQMAGDALELAAEDFRQVIDVNVTGSFLVARQTAKVMRRNGTGGSLLLIASMAAHAANRVSEPRHVSCCFSRLTHGANERTNRGSTTATTTRQKPGCSNSADLWHRSGVKTRSESTRYRRATCGLT